MIFPWQIKQWEQLKYAREINRLPHALLFTGRAGLGKAQFADFFSRALLCEQASANSNYCQKKLCHACRLLAGGVHPNRLWIKPEKEVIKIDQIRMIGEFVQHSALVTGERLVIIHPANAMNAHAANALLKTLEEPSAGVIIILICEHSQLLPATLKSRCQHIVFSIPKEEQAVQWLSAQLKNKKREEIIVCLKLTRGSPIAALQLARTKKLTDRQKIFTELLAFRKKEINLIDIMKKFESVELLQFIDLNLSLLLDVFRLQLGAKEITNEDYRGLIEEMAMQYHFKYTMHFSEVLQQLRREICHGVNFNKQLLMEYILIEGAKDRVFS